MQEEYYKEELEEKDREIAALEADLKAAQAEIRRLHEVCREYQKEIASFQNDMGK